MWDKARAGDRGRLSHPKNTGWERAEPAMAQPLEAAGWGLAPAGLPRSIWEQDGARPLLSRPGPGGTSWARQQQACRRDPRDAGGISTRGDCAIACGSAQLPGCLGTGSGSSMQPPARATPATKPCGPLLIPTLQPSPAAPQLWGRTSAALFVPFWQLVPGRTGCPERCLQLEVWGKCADPNGQPRLPTAACSLPVRMGERSEG